VKLTAAVELVARVTAGPWGAALVKRCRGGYIPGVTGDTGGVDPSVDITEKPARSGRSSRPRDTARRHRLGCRLQIGSCSA
jgi:hypothetical protein